MPHDTIHGLASHRVNFDVMTAIAALAAALLPPSAAVLPQRRLVAGAHPLLKARYAANGALAAADLAAAAVAAAAPAFAST